MEKLFAIHEIENKNRLNIGMTDVLGGDLYELLCNVRHSWLYARDDAYIYGGLEHGIVVAGHTPTTLEEELPYNDGNVYKSYDEDMDCTFYDIDCGYAFRNRRTNAKLACLRLDDEKIFYV